MTPRILSLGLLLLPACVANAATFDIATATDLFTPTFRGEADTTWVGWDRFGSPGDTVIADDSPDIGAAAGSFVTTNGEDHQSGSFNYYSGGGSVAEDITFDTDGVADSGFTTVIVQAKTLFGGWGSEIDFGPIAGVEPAAVLQATNAAGAGQLFVKYELPGVDGAQSFAIASGPESLISFDRFVIDSVWSPAGFAPDSAIATPEPSAAWIAAALLTPAFRRRRGGMTR